MDGALYEGGEHWQGKYTTGTSQEIMRESRGSGSEDAADDASKPLVCLDV